MIKKTVPLTTQLFIVLVFSVRQTDRHTHTHTHTHFDQVSAEFHGCPTNLVCMWISGVSELLRILICIHRCTVLYNTVKWCGCHRCTVLYNTVKWCGCSHHITFMICLYCYLKKLIVIVVVLCVLIHTGHIFKMHILLESYHLIRLL
jgi:hypothetical protein